MKKLLILAIVFAISAVANAGFSYSFTELQSLQFTDVDVDISGFELVNGASLLALVGDAAPTYFDDTLMQGSYGYYSGNLDDDHNGNNQYATLGTSVDITGQSTFTLTAYNDNDELWGYVLYAYDDNGTTDTADDILVTSSTTDFDWVIGTGTKTLPSNGTTMTLDLTSLSSSTVEIGIAIAAGSDSDAFHTSFVVPAPGAILLAGFGTSLVGLVRRRSL